MRRAVATGLLSALLGGGVAGATEIPVGLESPDVALRSDTDGLRYTRYERQGVTIELETQGGGSFGFWNRRLVPGDPDVYPDDVTPYVEDVTDCGNDDQCTPYVATFSVPIAGARVGFYGVANFSGSSAEITSATYFLEAWSGPNGTGTMLDRVTDPGGSGFPVPNGPNGIHLPANLVISTSGIRSIVFGADALTTYHGTQHVNLAWGVGLTLTIIPEPATGALMALGLLMLARRFGHHGQTPSSARFHATPALSRLPVLRAAHGDTSSLPVTLRENRPTDPCHYGPAEQVHSAVRARAPALRR
jgi:hypothetical protein